MFTVLWIVFGLLLIVAVWDLTQSRHAILRNFPLIGHLRYLLEAVGPELRQYIVTDNDEERPFSRDQRRWVYSTAKGQNSYFGFGTDNELELTPNYLVIKQSAFPVAAKLKSEPGYDPNYSLPCAKILGAARGRAKAFRPQSVIGVSAMSFGSLSSAAVEALNRGCAMSGCLHNTGEGGIAPYHQHGGELIWQLGTGYFGARDLHGNLSIERLVETCARGSVRAIEIKISQGAKPGLGGVLPMGKISEEIASIRGIPRDRDCISPPRHTAFGSVDELLDLVEKIAEATGLPVGVKSAVGNDAFWIQLCEQMAKDRGRGLDYVAVDGGEGGTGAAPLAFSDHVSLPFKLGMSRVYRRFAEHGLTDDVVFFGSGKLGFPQSALFGFALGCDMIMVAREAMLAIGCIQAQRCHSGHCPTGVATQNRWLMRGLDPSDKAARLANYATSLRKEVLALCHAIGVEHPALVGPDDLEIIDGAFGTRTVRDVFGYGGIESAPGHVDMDVLRQAMTPRSESVASSPHHG